MRISDWSSDVCSSDLKIARRKSRAIIERQRQRQYARQRDRPAHAGERHGGNQSPVGALTAAVLVALAQDGEPQGNPNTYETQRRQYPDDRDHIDNRKSVV